MCYIHIAALIAEYLKRKGKREGHVKGLGTWESASWDLTTDIH